MKARILIVGADFGETGDEAIRLGLQQLADSAAQAMFVVHVLAIDGASSPRAEAPSDPDAHTVQMVAESLALRVSQIALREHLPYHRELVRVEVRKGHVQQALLDAAREHHAELLIVGTHGRHGIDRLLAGSIAESLVRRAPCSVLVARVGARVRQGVRQPIPHRDHSAYSFDPALLAKHEA
jgi:nucleotide-binding universal stress UspA family protein